MQNGSDKANGKTEQTEVQMSNLFNCFSCSVTAEWAHSKLNYYVKADYDHSTDIIRANQSQWF